MKGDFGDCDVVVVLALEKLFCRMFEKVLMERRLGVRCAQNFNEFSIMTTMTMTMTMNFR